MFEVVLAEIKAYATAIVGVLLVVAVAGTGLKIKWLTHQRDVAVVERDKAKNEAERMGDLIAAYQSASDAARARVDAAVENSELLARRHAALVNDLHSSLPKNPDEALAWAIASGRKIGEAPR